MRKFTLNLLALCFSFCLLQSANLFGQSALPVAKMNAQMQILIDESSPLVSSYSLNTGDLAFSSVEAKERFLKSLTDNLISVSFDKATGEAILHLQLQYTTDKKWGVAEWNNYLSGNADRYRKNFERINAEN